jgi:hypothetical protein
MENTPKVFKITKRICHKNLAMFSYCAEGHKIEPISTNL